MTFKPVDVCDQSKAYIVLDTVSSCRTAQDIDLEQDICDRTRGHTADTASDGKDGEGHSGNSWIIT